MSRAISVIPSNGLFVAGSSGKKALFAGLAAAMQPLEGDGAIDQPQDIEAEMNSESAMPHPLERLSAARAQQQVSAIIEHVVNEHRINLEMGQGLQKLTASLKEMSDIDESTLKTCSMILFSLAMDDPRAFESLDALKEKSDLPENVAEWVKEAENVRDTAKQEKFRLFLRSQLEMMQFENEAEAGAKEEKEAVAEAEAVEA